MLADAIDPAETSITLEGFVDANLVQPGTWAQIDDEIVRIDTLSTGTGVATIGRGVLDTVARPHAAGARIYFRDGFAETDGIERVESESIDVKLLPRTGLGHVDIDDVSSDSVTFAGRWVRPYPPGPFTINGEEYPGSIVEPAYLELEWAHRDRTQQNLEGDESGDIGPEAGTTYSLRITNLDTSNVAYSKTGINDNTHIVETDLYGTFEALVELWSVRDGFESWQKRTHVFNYDREAPALTAARYWRIAISTNNGHTNYTSIAEIEMRSTVGGANIATGGTASASSNFAPAANAFDGNSGSIWAAGPGGVLDPVRLRWIRPGGRDHPAGSQQRRDQSDAQGLHCAILERRIELDHHRQLHG